MRDVGLCFMPPLNESVPHINHYSQNKSVTPLSCKSCLTSSLSSSRDMILISQFYFPILWVNEAEVGWTALLVVDNCQLFLCVCVFIWDYIVWFWFISIYVSNLYLVINVIIPLYLTMMFAQLYNWQISTVTRWNRVLNNTIVILKFCNSESRRSQKSIKSG